MIHRPSSLNLGLATVAFAVSFAVWSVVSPLSSAIQAEFRLDNSAAGLLIAVPALLGALMRVPIGVLTDRFGGRAVFTGLLLFLLLPLAFLGFAHTYAQYVIGACFLGTAGASFAVGVPFVTRWFPPQRQGTALGIYGIGNIGTAAAALTMPGLAQGLGGRQNAFWFCLIPVAIVAAVFWIFARDAPAPARPEPEPLAASMARAFRDPLVSHLSLFYFVTFGGFVFFANYLPQLLGDWFPFGRRDAALAAAIFTIAATLARPVGGWLSDQIGGTRVLTWIFAFIVVTRLLLAWQASSANVVIITKLLLIVAIALGLGSGAVFKLVAQFFPKNTGLVSGFVGCAGGLGGFFPPLVVRFGHDQTGNYALGFIVLSILSGYCLALMIARSPEEVRAS